MTNKSLDDKSARPGAPPLSRPLAVAEIPAEGLEIEIVASESERAALAKLNGIPAILSFAAALRARRLRGDGLEVTGDLRARVRQTCVLSLEEFDSDIVEPLELRFAPPKETPRPHSRRKEVEPEPLDHDALGDDPPDPLIGGVVDLGAVVAEFFTLSLDPYPHKPGAEFAEPAPDDASGSVSPFAQLRGTRGEPPAEA